MKTTTYPDCYLHVQEFKSGEEWIIPIKGNMRLDLKTRVEHWCRVVMGGQVKLDGEIMRLIDGDYYAKIITDGRPPTSTICWTGGGFYLKSTY